MIKKEDFLGEVGKTTKNMVLFVGNDDDSKKLLEDIKLWGAHDRIKIVDVSVNGLLGWLLVEYGSAKTPLLATNSTVLSGYNEIKSYISSLLSRK